MPALIGRVCYTVHSAKACLPGYHCSSNMSECAFPGHRCAFARRTLLATAARLCLCVAQVKTGPFFEHSRYLYDMSSVPSWKKVHYHRVRIARCGARACVCVLLRKSILMARRLSPFRRLCLHHAHALYTVHEALRDVTAAPCLDRADDHRKGGRTADATWLPDT